MIFLDNLEFEVGICTSRATSCLLVLLRRHVLCIIIMTLVNQVHDACQQPMHLTLVSVYQARQVRLTLVKHNAPCLETRRRRQRVASCLFVTQSCTQVMRLTVNLW